MVLKTHLLCFAFALISVLEAKVAWDLSEKEENSLERRECIPVDEHCQVGGTHCCRRRECRCNDSGKECKCIEVHRTEPEYIVQMTKEPEELHTKKPEIEVYTERPEIEVYTEKPEIEVYTEKPEIEVYTEKPELVDHTEKPDFFEAAFKYLILLEKLNNITISFARQMYPMYG